MKHVQLPTTDPSTVQVVQVPTARDKIKTFFKNIWDFTISKPNPKESVIQWALRQFIIADSDGNPSWTITIATVVMVYIGIAMMSELTVAISTVKTYDPTTGKLISEGLHGISDSFWYLMITLGGAVTYLFQQRAKHRGKENGKDSSEDTPTTPVENIISTAVETVKKLKGGK
jgi:hypothetical protein